MAVAKLAASPYLMGVGNNAGPKEIKTVKILLALSALAGSLTLLLSEWAGQTITYL